MILITGAAGFIGFHAARAFLARGDDVLAIDNFNSYYDPNLKKARIAKLEEENLPGRLHFSQTDLAQRDSLFALLGKYEIKTIVHLAAQAGVRHSLQNPFDYIDGNLVAFSNVMEWARQREVSHFVYASSSSVYGGSQKIPFDLDDRADQPISLYAATKRANELLAYSYSHLYRLPVSGLRFFTVYGPWGRPDMAIFHFTQSILAGRTIDVFHEGTMRRDFTYIDDAIFALMQIADHPPGSDLSANGESVPSRLYNISQETAVEVSYLIKLIEAELGKKAVIRYLPKQPGDMLITCGVPTPLPGNITNHSPVPIEEGIKRFVQWYLERFPLYTP